MFMLHYHVTSETLSAKGKLYTLFFQITEAANIYLQAELFLTSAQALISSYSTTCLEFSARSSSLQIAYEYKINYYKSIVVFIFQQFINYLLI